MELHVIKYSLRHHEAPQQVFDKSKKIEIRLKNGKLEDAPSLERHVENPTLEKSKDSQSL